MVKLTDEINKLKGTVDEKASFSKVSLHGVSTGRQFLSPRRYWVELRIASIRLVAVGLSATACTVQPAPTSADAVVLPMAAILNVTQQKRISDVHEVTSANG